MGADDVACNGGVPDKVGIGDASATSETALLSLALRLSSHLIGCGVGSEGLPSIVTNFAFSTSVVPRQKLGSLSLRVPPGVMG